MTMSFDKEQEDEFRKAFDLFDNDGSGTISSRELIQAMQNLNLRPREEEIQNIVRVSSQQIKFSMSKCNKIVGSIHSEN